MYVLWGYPFSLSTFYRKPDAKKFQEEQYKLSATCFESLHRDKSMIIIFIIILSSLNGSLGAVLLSLGLDIVIYMSQSWAWSLLVMKI